jgi:hypothetical protein
MMNQRIKELAEQAGFIPDNAPGMNPVLEKFAELIVKECMDIVSAGINNATDWDSSYWDQACGNRAQAIKQHFGVE